MKLIDILEQSIADLEKSAEIGASITQKDMSRIEAINFKLKQCIGELNVLPFTPPPIEPIIRPTKKSFSIFKPMSQ